MKKKVFTMFANDHHGDGHIAVWIPAPLGLQESLIASEANAFFRPPYVGVKGWMGVELAKISDKKLRALIEDGWRMVAPKKLVAEFDGEG